ncbi:aspartate aminotransferase family protein [Candidatus Saganbacteria bacterium CG08_land_8_20_14_0_20_45_16]|uniref:(S)-3-amino-2-methylpropionate transaminase n=1 Tax=Candidatus Saganbacteria bacterium CG08_land_8_20_14_0_20_45_16 TaxID=2014293 RepID=A0A2H0XYL8_UNCSA|nr:MAG: aspartate aminotransferase family protein [Candidatus Saganbacteria bacterium CG08_land_8_20_14_0_20_45_16]
MKKLSQRAKKVLSPVLGRYFGDFEINKAAGMYLFGTDGKKYLDFSSGIAVCAIGHCHPQVVKAAEKQLKSLIHICIGIAGYESYIKLAEELQKIVPVSNAQFFFCQSGSEAVEAALKLARYATKKPGIIAMKGDFHGRTMGALSLTTSKMKYREGYEPLVPEIFIAEPSLANIEELMKNHEIAGLILEPILGEGGYVPLPKELVQGIRELCNKYNVLMIADEIQSGFGRTGKWFAIEHYGVKPDVICMAKGIASGFPLGGIAASAEIMAKWSPGAHGGTYGGNPVCCAAAIATVDVIKKGKLLQNAKTLGSYATKKLQALAKKYPAIKAVRGPGLMIGIDFGESAIVRKIIDYCLANGLVIIPTGANGTVIRFIPPLIVKKADIDQALKVFGASLSNELS